MDNYKKYEKYSELMQNLNKAIKNEFFYEAIFISYAVLEDRTDSLLKHAGLKTNTNDSQTLTLAKKIDKIKRSAIFQDLYIKKHLTEDLISDIIFWKNKRNKLIHNLVYCSYSNEEIKIIAKEGYELVKKLNNKSTLINKYLETTKVR